MFENELREHVGQRTQVVTPNSTLSGVLIAVTSASVTVRTTQPDYGQTEDVIVPLSSIAYVRFFV
jgi:hypothetical protein